MIPRQPDKPAPLFDPEPLKAAAAKRTAEPEKPQATCRTCGKPIVWARTEQGKAAPFEAKPITVYVINAAGIAAPLPGHVSHFATCPQAAQHRRDLE